MQTCVRLVERYPETRLFLSFKEDLRLVIHREIADRCATEINLIYGYGLLSLFESDPVFGDGKTADLYSRPVFNPFENAIKDLV